MRSMKMPTPLRSGLFAMACLILVLQASASRMLKIDEQKIGNPGLRQLPLRIDKWVSSEEQSMGPEVVAYLKPDEYILRDYADQQGGTTINFFVAYFKSLQNVYGPHSPRICLPGSGWLVSNSKIATISVPGRPEGISVNQYTMEKSNQRILVLYWYQNDRDVWAEEYHAKLRMLPDLFRYRRSDVSLVRLVTLVPESTPEKELTSCVRFAQDMFPLLAARFATVTAQP
jgi:EpsI family protein